MTALPASADAVVVGAGVVGACCALSLARAGLSVCVVDRGAPAGGTTGAGEGNLLVSDKPPGPELDLARRSLTLWRELADDLPDPFELEAKGGLVVAHTHEQLAALHGFADGQRRAGVTAQAVEAAGLGDLEPLLTPEAAGGVLYPEDAQVQPMLACWAILRAAERLGARLAPYTEVVTLRRSAPAGGGPGGIAGVVTTRGTVATPVVVDAAGPWSGELAARLGAAVPVLPRRGQVLVTEPLGPAGDGRAEADGTGPAGVGPGGTRPGGTIRHKVYDSDYVGTVVREDDVTACSAVVEGTASGTVLIGSSREFAAFDRRPNLAVLAEMARRAVRLFPPLERVRALRTYLGFRAVTPDHLPLVGPDPVVPGLHHATGHEGAGIGLAPATGELLATLVTGRETGTVDPAPFAPARFPGPLGVADPEAAADA